MWLTIVRHLIAALASYLVSLADGHGIQLDRDQLISVMIGTYAIVEKLLKPATQKMGEPRHP